MEVAVAEQAQLVDRAAAVLLAAAVMVALVLQLFHLGAVQHQQAKM
jgi:hypothetical protein